MNIVKIQQDVIKDTLNGKADNWFVQINDSETIVFNKYQVYVLDPKDFLLDYSKLINAGVQESTVANKALDNADNAKPAIKTPVLRVLDDKTCIELKREDNGELVYVDQALLKYYDKLAEFEAINSVSPVFVYEDDILVGLVLPVKVS